MSKTKRQSLCFFSFFCFSFFILSFLVPALEAKNISKTDVLEKYDAAVSRAEEVNLYQEDVLHILPKIRLASKALLRNDFAQADRLLDEALSDLKDLESKKPKEFKSEMKNEWLEIYIDVIQKYIFLAFLAYLIVKWPYFGRMLGAGGIPFTGKILLSITISLLAIFLSFFDLSRYGVSTWAFFDIQVVLIAVGGLLGGIWTGLLAGVLIGLFRWFLKPEFLLYSGIALGAGVLSGIFPYKIGFGRGTARKSFLAGFLVGAFHGAVIYLRALSLMPWYYVLLSILLLAVIEGLGVYIFFAVISGVLRETHRREMERELLKTKLLFLQSQMRPHFLFNALNAISAICHRENALQAQNLIVKLADFLRKTLKRQEDFVTLKEEISYIDSYLEIEKARLADRLKVEKQFEIHEDLWTTKIPLLILQPLVENAVQHGISKKESGGTLRIHLYKKGDVLNMEISDDGMGMEASYIQRILNTNALVSEKLGIGVRNIHQRLIRLYGPSHGLKFESKLGKGTDVTVRIPI